MQPEPFAPQVPEQEQEPAQPPLDTTSEYSELEPSPQVIPEPTEPEATPLYNTAFQQSPEPQQVSQTQAFTSTQDVEQTQPQLLDEEPQPSLQQTYEIPQAQQPSSVQAQDPGKVLGIIGFVFAFLFLQPIGLILSIIGYYKSKKAGLKNGLAVAGIWLNGIGIAIALLGFILFVLATLSIIQVDETTQTRLDSINSSY